MSAERFGEPFVKPHLVFGLQMQHAFDQFQRRGSHRITADAAGTSTTETTGTTASNPASSTPERRRQGIDVIVSLALELVAFVMGFDEGRMIDVDEERHKELAVEAVGEAAVTRDDGAKVFDVEGAFEAGSEEATKGRHERPEDREDEGVELEWVAGRRKMKKRKEN